jgi:hypothetical protein
MLVATGPIDDQPDGSGPIIIDLFFYCIKILLFTFIHVIHIYRPVYTVLLTTSQGNDDG